MWSQLLQVKNKNISKKKWNVRNLSRMTIKLLWSLPNTLKKTQVLLRSMIISSTGKILKTKTTITSSLNLSSRRGLNKLLKKMKKKLKKDLLLLAVQHWEAPQANGDLNMLSREKERYLVILISTENSLREIHTLMRKKICSHTEALIDDQLHHWDQIHPIEMYKLNMYLLWELPSVLVSMNSIENKERIESTWSIKKFKMSTPSNTKCCNSPTVSEKRSFRLTVKKSSLTNTLNVTFAT